MSTTNRSDQSGLRDGPATIFREDPMVMALFSNAAQESPQEHQQEPEKTKKEQTSPYFGLVLVTGWPPSQTLIDPYQKFISMVKQCFDPEDVQGSRPAVYLYPSAHLHVTVATLYPVRKVRLSAENEGKHDSSIAMTKKEENKIVTQWKEFVQNAKQNTSKWPLSQLQFQMDHCQIGTSAGILLWKETTGGLDQIRSCLKEFQDQQKQISQSIKIHSIPKIVHSTFLRFHKLPKTRGEDVQKRFQSLVVPNLSTVFQTTPFVASDIKLVCERCPYMHIPNDDHHVFLKLSLEDSNS